MEDPQNLPSSPHSKTHHPINHSRLMEKLKNRVLNAANSDPKRPLTPSQIALLQQRLLHAFPSFHLPTHPPYAAMIQNAAQDLISEHRVSDEVAISEYIKEKYTGLPWAHKRYLSHHLKKLCDTGELLWDHSDGNYIPPSKRMPGNRHRSPGKRKLQRRRRDDVIEEGLVAGEELAEVSDSQVGIQEYENQPISVKRGRRRRRTIVVDEEDDEVGEAVVVEGGNVEPLDTGTGVGDQDLVLVVQESTKGQQAVGHEGESDQKVDDLCSKQCEDEAKIVVCSSAHDHCEGNSALENFVVSSTIVKCGGERTTDTVQSDGGNRGANLMIVPYEGAKESGMESDNCNYSVALQLAPVMDDTLASVTNMENGVLGGMVTDAVLEGNKHDHSYSKLIMVPFEGDTISAGGQRRKWLTMFTNVPIVCGLACQSLGPWKPTQKLKKAVSHRRRSKIPQVKAKLSAEQLVLPLPSLPVGKGLKTKKAVKLKGVVQSQQAYMSPLHEDIAIEKWDSHKSSHPTSLEVTVMDELENLPLNRWKEFATQKVSVKAPSVSASSQTDVEYYNDLPKSENFVQITARIEEGFTSTERTGKKQQQDQPKMQLWSHDLTSDNLNVEEKGSGRHEIAKVQIDYLMNDSMLGRAVMKHLDQSQCEHGSPSLKKTALTCLTQCELPLMEIYQQMGVEQALPKSNELADKDRCQSYTSQYQNEQKEDEKGVNKKCNADFCHSQMATSQEALAVDNRKEVIEEHAAVPCQFIQDKQTYLSKSGTNLHLQQGNKEPKKYSLRGPQKSTERTMENEADSLSKLLEEQIVLSEATTCELSHQENMSHEKSGRRRQCNQKETLENEAISSKLHRLALKVSEPETDQPSKLEQDYRVRLRKRKEAPSEDAYRSSIGILEGQEMLYVAATSENSLQLNKLVEKRGRGRPKKQASETSSGKLQNEQLKRDDLEGPQKQKEETSEGSDVQPCAIDLHEEQRFELATYQHTQHHNKPRKRGRPPKQNVVGEEILKSPSYFAHQHSYYQTRRTKRDGQERLGDETKTDKDEQSERAINSVEEPSAMLRQNEDKGQEMTDDYISCPFPQLSAITTTEGPVHLSIQSSQQHKEQKEPPSTRRSTRSSASKSMLDPRSDKQHNLELVDPGKLVKLTHFSVPSDQESLWQEKDHTQHNFPDIESKDSWNEETQKHIEVDKEEQWEKVVASSDNSIGQQMKQQKIVTEEIILQSKSVTKLSDSQLHEEQDTQLHEEQAEEGCDEHGQKQGNSKSQVRPLKEKTIRTSAILVPLSSKDQLRSRIKH